jgi:hypothetical protein
MCCLSRKTFCASKLRHVPQSVASATRDVAKVIIRERSRITAQILSIKCEGIFPAFSLYRVEAILDWVHQLAPSACAWNQHRAVGPWLATVWHRDSGFPLQSSALPRGRAVRRFFWDLLFAGFEQWVGLGGGCQIG